MHHIQLLFPLVSPREIEDPTYALLGYGTFTYIYWGGGTYNNYDWNLSNRDRLLLHHFVNCRAVSIHHLVKLVNAADTLVGQHQRSPLQSHLASQIVFHHRRSETDAGRAAARCILT